MNVLTANIYQIQRALIIIELYSIQNIDRCCPWNETINLPELCLEYRTTHAHTHIHVKYVLSYAGNAIQFSNKTIYKRGCSNVPFEQKSLQCDRLAPQNFRQIRTVGGNITAIGFGMCECACVYLYGCVCVQVYVCTYVCKPNKHQKARKTLYIQYSDH